MLFNSFSFLFVFLPVVALGYAGAVRRGSPRAGTVWILIASLVFYAWASPAHLPWLLGSIGFNHLVDRAMERATHPRTRSRWLGFGLVVNVLCLALLKYTNFFLGIVEPLLGRPPHRLDIGFPLGVSFFTLQQIMYLMDRYEGLVPSTGLLEHATFVAFFPTVSSGPITRARPLLPQLTTGTGPTARNIAQGLTLFALGLCKKVVLADSFGRLANAGFDNLGLASTVEAWIASISYSCQIYFDFSGYSDMAVATGLFLGMVLPNNFDAPYRSRSVAEFWQRWHITLSQFITTYLYTPLVRGRKVTLLRASYATMIAMAIAGLWHGPSWTFVAFGLIHGAGLVINQVWRKKVKVKVPAYVAWPATMLFVNTAFVFFRAPTIAAALNMCRRLVSWRHVLGTEALKTSIRMHETGVLGVSVIAGLLFAVIRPTSTHFVEHLRPTVPVALAVAFVWLVALWFLNSTITTDFIYFAF